MSAPTGYKREHLLATLKGYLRDAEDYERAGDYRNARVALETAEFIADQLRGGK